MKVNVVPKKEKSITYPFIGITRDGLIVLFSSEKCGITLRGVGVFRRGEYSDNWGMSLFNPYQGTIELSND